MLFGQGLQSTFLGTVIVIIEHLIAVVSVVVFFSILFVLVLIFFLIIDQSGILGFTQAGEGYLLIRIETVPSVRVDDDAAINL